MVFGKKKSTAAETVTVEKHDITEVVSATGNVTPLSDLDLAFQASGQVSHVAVAVGDTVYQGEYLASLSNADLSAVGGTGKSGIAKLNRQSLPTCKMGLRRKRLRVAQNSLNNSITSAYTTCDNAIHNDIDQMFHQSENSIAKITIPMNDFQLQNTINNDRYSIETGA